MERGWEGGSSAASGCPRYGESRVKFLRQRCRTQNLWQLALAGVRVCARDCNPYPGRSVCVWGGSPPSVATHYCLSDLTGGPAVARRLAPGVRRCRGWLQPPEPLDALHADCEPCCGHALRKRYAGLRLFHVLLVCLVGVFASQCPQLRRASCDRLAFK